MNFKIKKYSKLLIVLIVTVTSGLAQTINPIESVLEVNREVLAAEKEYQAAKEKIKVSGVLPDPMIETSFSINPLETRNGPVENQIMLGQKFPMWGKLRKERSIERIKSEISRLNLETTKVKVSFLLRKYLADHSKLTESLEILKQYQIDLETFQTIAQSQYANGIGLTQHPIIKLQIEESIVETKINKLESALERNINDLQVLYDGQFLFSQVNSDFDLIIESLSKDQWVDLANSKSPKYLQAQARVAVASDQYKLSKLKNYPDLVAGMTYSIVGPTDLGGAVSSGADALGVKVGINVPLWFRKNKAKVKAASFIQKQQEELLSDTWNKIEFDILSIIKELSEVKETYTLYNDSIIYETDQMLSSAYSAYETGKISFLDLLDSVRLGVKVKLEFEDIKAKQTTLVAKLYQSTGIINQNQEN